MKPAAICGVRAISMSSLARIILPVWSPPLNSGRSCGPSAPEEGLDIERERRNALLRRAHPAAQEGLGGELVLAADQFVITPADAWRIWRVPGGRR